MQYDRLTRLVYTTGLVTALLALTCGAAAIGQEDEDEPKAPARLSSEYYTSGRAMLKIFRPVVSKAARSTVRIRCNRRNAALGTVVDAKGYIVTKASELKGAVSVRMRNGKELPAAIIGIDQTTDLAMLKIDYDGLQPIVWAESELEVGAWAATVGQRVDPVAVGVVSVLERKIDGKKALVGVMLESVDGPPKVEHVLPNMGPAKAGLKPGDIITHVDGEEVKTREEMVKRLTEFTPGETVDIKVERDGESLDKQITLMEPPTGPMNRGNFQNRLGGPLSGRNYGFKSVFQHDTVIRPSDCGSPVVGLDGKALGINIARAGRVATYALPASLVKSRLADLKSGKLAPNVLPAGD